MAYTVGVNESLNGCRSEDVSRPSDWWAAEGVTGSSPDTFSLFERKVGEEKMGREKDFLALMKCFLHAPSYNPTS